jgi:hypothetical protein
LPLEAQARGQDGHGSRCYGGYRGGQRGGQHRGIGTTSPATTARPAASAAPNTCGIVFYQTYTFLYATPEGRHWR